MTVKQLKNAFGVPVDENRNRLTYVFEDASELVVTLRDNIVTSAQLNYLQPLKISDPEMRQLTLVQMQSEENYMNQPTWFFAGKPKDGLIYKITSDGIVESLTWVPPFTYGTQRPKQLQALMHDFQSQNSTQM
jgi:hypothetical protein